MQSLPINSLKLQILSSNKNHIGGVMVGVLALNVVDCGFMGGVMVGVLALNVVDRGFVSWLS